DLLDGRPSAVVGIAREPAEHLIAHANLPTQRLACGGEVVLLAGPGRPDGARDHVRNLAVVDAGGGAARDAQLAFFLAGALLDVPVPISVPIAAAGGRAAAGAFRPAVERAVIQLRAADEVAAVVEHATFEVEPADVV